METKEKEILEELMRLASEDTAQHLSDFFMFALTQDEIRSNITNEQASKMFLTIQLMKEAYKLSE